MQLKTILVIGSLLTLTLTGCGGSSVSGSGVSRIQRESGSEPAHTVDAVEAAHQAYAGGGYLCANGVTSGVCNASGPTPSDVVPLDSYRRYYSCMTSSSASMGGYPTDNLDQSATPSHLAAMQSALYTCCYSVGRHMMSVNTLPTELQEGLTIKGAILNAINYSLLTVQSGVSGCEPASMYPHY